MNFPDHPFWDFSLTVYGTEGVAPACLSLQDRHGIDVNILMFCLWLGAAGYTARDEAGMRRIVEAVALWHDNVVRALRAVRKRMKQPIDRVDHHLAQSVRARIQKAEIDTEHLEQLALAKTVDGEDASLPEGQARAEAAGRNVSAYFTAMGISPGKKDLNDLEHLFAAAFPNAGQAAMAAFDH